MSWLEIAVRVTPELVEPTVALFDRYGNGAAIEQVPGEEMVTLRTYISQRAHQKRARLEAGLRLVSLIQPVVGPTVTTLEEADWATAWRSHFSVIHLGLHTVIRPSWIAYEPKAGEVVLDLDPGMAFGTGHHPTTALCLQAIEKHATNRARVLDVGTGSGILTISAMKHGAAAAVALDIDADAVRTARANLRINGIRTGVRVVRGTLPSPAAPIGSFDLIVANISAQVIARLAAHLTAALTPGGVLVASGIIEDQRGIAETALAGQPLARVETLKDGDWYALVYRAAAA